LLLVVRIRVRAGHGTLFRGPLMGPRRALGQFPFVAEQAGEESVAPLGRSRGPGDFEATADLVAAPAPAEAALPAQALLLDGRGFRLRADQRRIARAVGLAESVAAGNQRDRFL